MLDRSQIKHAAFALALTFVLFCAAFDAPRPRTPWVGTWATAQQIPEPHNALPAADFTDATFRQIVRVSIGGQRVRLRLSNAFGTTPLELNSVRVARSLGAGAARIDVASDRMLTFSGRPNVIIPAGAEYVSDPFAFPLAPFTDLAISFHVTSPPAQQTSHPGSRTTTFYVHGDHTGAPDLPGAKTVAHWWVIARIDVVAPRQAASVAIVGDSITDGRGSTTDGNNRWTDMLALRLQANAATRYVGVLNQGLGGNRILRDGNGPNALARFDRDVIAQTGIKYVIVLEGVNDLGTLNTDRDASFSEYEALAASIISAYEQMIERAHANGLKIYGATIMPYAGQGTYRATPQSERARTTINQWIRTSGKFDAVIDFDLVVRDPAQPDRLLPAYDVGDHLHVNPTAFQAMADSVPLSLFER